MIVGNTSSSLEEMVYASLEEEILSGDLVRGDSLGEIALSKRLGVSRTPIRSALHRLAEEGLVDIIPNKGATVIGINTDDLIDIYRIRERLEGLASSLAAKRITEEEINKLSETLDLSNFYIKRRDAEHIKELDTAFHSMIYKTSGSRFLERTLSELHRKIKSYRKRSLSVPGRVERSEAEHREILAAIKAGDSEMADKLTSLHVQRALENMLSALEVENK